MHDSSRISHKDRLPLVVGLLLLCLGTILVYFFTRSLAEDLVENSLSTRTASFLDARRSAAVEGVAQVRRFIGLVTSSPAIEALLEAEAVDGASAPASGMTEARGAGDWLIGFMDYAPSVEQVKILSQDGTELLWVDRQGGVPRIVRKEAAPDGAEDEGFPDFLASSTRELTGATVGLALERRDGGGGAGVVLRSVSRLYGRDGRPLGLISATHAALPLLIDPALDLDAGLEYHVFDGEGRWLAKADSAVPFAWAPEGDLRWEDRYTPAAAAAGRESGNLRRFRGPDGPVLVGETVVDLGDEPASFVTLRLVTTPSLLAQAVSSLQWRLAIPAYLILGIALGALVWAGARHGRSGGRGDGLNGQLIEQGPAAMLVLKADGEVLLCNRRGRELLGFAAGEIEGANFFALAVSGNDESSGLDAAALEKHAASDAQGSDVTLVVRGRTHHLHWQVARLSSEGGDDRFVINFTDAYSQRMRRERLEGSNEELQRQLKACTLELEAAKKLAMSANEIKSDFIANVSHELRTPLHGISGTLRLLRQDPLNERQQYNLMLAEESVSELTTVINSIIDVSKLEADRLTIEETDISLLALVHDAAQKFAPRAAEKRLTFAIDDIELGNELVLGDGDRITRIINILMENAIKFTEHGNIDARFTSSLLDDEEVLFECTISDTGRGMSAEQRRQLFEPFHSGPSESASTGEGGVGLGLVIAKQLCNLMWGDLEIDSQPGEGTRCLFRIRLPLSEQQPQAGVPFRPLAGKRVALVQEETATRNILRRLLENAEASVSEAAGLYEINEAHWRDIDFLVLDLDVFERNADFVGEQASTRSASSTITVLATAVRTTASSERERDLPDNVFVLPLPATTVGLESVLLAASGEGAPHRDYHFDPLVDTSHDAWSVLPDLRALVVDDNLVNQHVVGGLLEEYGADVEYVNNGQEVLDLLLRKGGRVFDVILMDCQMPVMDGYEASRRIRAGAAGEAYIDIPIIAVTAAALGGDRRKCLDSGMTDYIVKPVKPNVLERSILRYVKRSDAASTSARDEGGPSPDQDDSEAGESVRDTLAARLRRREDWNRTAFKARVMDNMEIVHTISDLYLQNAPELIEGIVGGVDGEDYREVRNMAHELSGMSENLGAEKIALITREIELAALDRRGDDLRYLIRELHDHYDDLQGVLKE